MATEEEISGFLRMFKDCWPPRCYVVPRDKNLEGLTALGLTPKQREHEIMSLTSRHYSKGPEPDEGSSREEVWIFQKRIRGYDVYIKLKTYKVGKKTFGKCLSFHP